MRKHILKVGESAYYDSLTCGPVPCKVQGFTVTPEGMLCVLARVTASRGYWKRGETISPLARSVFTFRPKRQDTLSIRPKVYRGVSGWSLSGKVPGSSFPVRIFFKTRQGATQGKAAYRAHAAGTLDMSGRNQAIAALLMAGM